MVKKTGCLMSHVAGAVAWMVRTKLNDDDCYVVENPVVEDGMHR